MHDCYDHNSWWHMSLGADIYRRISRYKLGPTSIHSAAIGFGKD